MNRIRYAAIRLAHAITRRFMRWLKTGRKMPADAPLCLACQELEHDLCFGPCSCVARM